MAVYDENNEHEKEFMNNINDPDFGKCSFCGGNAKAYWHGFKGCIFSCSRCATNDLPKLIADATVSKYDGFRRYSLAISTFRKMETPYLQAVLCKVCKDDEAKFKKMNENFESVSDILPRTMGKITNAEKRKQK
jgi:hypothetical protein